MLNVANLLEICDPFAEFVLVKRLADRLVCHWVAGPQADVDYKTLPEAAGDLHV